MVERIKRFIQKYNMIKPGDRILAGVSGGADSVCLCLVLWEISAQMGFSLEAVHVEHGIRGEESREDARFVRELCARLGIPCHEVPVDVPGYAGEHRLGLEEAARELRYEAFSRIAGVPDPTEGELPGAKEIPNSTVEKKPAAAGRTAVALAHHMEDNAETILLQMIRGSGLDGLCGMSPVRTGAGGERYLRPLLGERRAAIEAFLAERGQPFREDSTNSDPAYSRNRIRQSVLPELCALNPQALCHMNRTAERMRDLRDYMDGQTTARAEQLLAERDGDFVLPVEALCDMPRALRMRLIHRAVGEAAGARKDISAVHIEAVEQLLWKQSGRRVDLPYGIVAKRVYGELVIGAGNRGGAQKPDGTQCSDGSRFPDGVMWADAAHREIRVDIDLLSIGNPLVITLSDGQLICRVFPFFGNIAKIPQKLYTKWFDYDKIKDNFSIRTRRTGDFFILDDAGHHKKLADYFIGEKIPADRRDEYLLVAQESKVLWVIGGRMGCDVGVSEDTHMILEMTFTKARKI